MHATPVRRMVILSVIVGLAGACGDGSAAGSTIRGTLSHARQMGISSSPEDHVWSRRILALGQIQERSSIEGRWQDEFGIRWVGVLLAYQSSHEDDSSLAAIAGNYADAALSGATFSGVATFDAQSAPLIALVHSSVGRLADALVFERQ